MLDIDNTIDTLIRIQANTLLSYDEIMSIIEQFEPKPKIATVSDTAKNTIIRVHMQQTGAATFDAEQFIADIAEINPKADLSVVLFNTFENEGTTLTLVNGTVDENGATITTFNTLTEFQQWAESVDLIKYPYECPTCGCKLHHGDISFTDVNAKNVAIVTLADNLKQLDEYISNTSDYDEKEDLKWQYDAMERMQNALLEGETIVPCPNIYEPLHALKITAVSDGSIDIKHFVNIMSPDTIV